MIPNVIIRDLIRERSNLQYQVQKEIASSWGYEQTLRAAILEIPTRSKNVDSDGKIWYSDGQIYILPKEIDYKINIDPEIKHRGIYQATLYNSTAAVVGKFDLSKINFNANPDEKILWGNARLLVGISDPSGLKEVGALSLSDKSYEFEPNLAGTTPLNSGFHSPVSLTKEDTIFSFSFNLSFNGYQELFIDPMGLETTVTMTSPWSDPSFSGSILPKHNTNEKGFNAEWKSTPYNMSYPNNWRDNIRVNKDSGKFGVTLINTVDHYRKNTRSAKYALLIISLTFLVYFFFENFKKQRIHPLQYILVGLALSVFYLLLLSFTEHIGFDWAYLVSSVATIGLLGIYSAHAFKNKTSALWLSIILSGIFGYIFVLLQMTDYALLAGSLGLFIILAVVMILSRKINWYGEES